MTTALIRTAAEILADLEAAGGEVDEQPTLTTKAAAQLAGVDDSTIHRWATSGRLPATWVHARRRFRESDVLAAMEAK